MSDEVPVWVWLPGADTPVEAGGLRFQQGEYRFAYRPEYKGNPALDPVRLRIKAGNAVGEELAGLEDDAPASRAMRRANQDEGTSAGGERPKATFSFMDKMWLVKMQDRGDRQGMPAMEFTTMRLAALAEITARRMVVN